MISKFLRFPISDADVRWMTHVEWLAASDQAEKPFITPCSILDVWRVIIPGQAKLVFQFCQFLICNSDATFADHLGKLCCCSPIFNMISIIDRVSPSHLHLLEFRICWFDVLVSCIVQNSAEYKIIELSKMQAQRMLNNVSLVIDHHHNHLSKSHFGTRMENWGPRHYDLRDGMMLILNLSTQEHGR